MGTSSNVAIFSLQSHEMYFSIIYALKSCVILVDIF
uniref:Uncharacterized protein n=1 Tax=Rhizophora mucronata TaxID=61149 RepID=A0A2P2N740_RHIMU